MVQKQLPALRFVISTPPRSDELEAEVVSRPFPDVTSLSLREQSGEAYPSNGKSPDHWSSDQAVSHLRRPGEQPPHDSDAASDRSRLVFRARTASYSALQLALAGVNAALRTADEDDLADVELVIDLKNDCPRAFCAILR